MAVMQWNPAYRLGIGEIDDQHAQLVAMINDLDEAIRDGRAPEMTGRLLHSLMSYCRMHFTTEELYFSECEYPDAIPHRNEHLAFIDRVGRFARAFGGGATDISGDLLSFLSEWLRCHIQSSDRDYVQCFQEHGVK